MIFDFSDKINQNGLKLIFSNAEESSILTKKSIVSMVQTHSTNIEMVNDKRMTNNKKCLERRKRNRNSAKEKI